MSTSVFCKVLKEFLTDIYNSYPDPSLFILIQATDALIMTSPRSVVDNYMLCVDKYKTQIANKDESFFLEGHLGKELKGTPYEFLLDELEKIIKIWNDPKTSSKTKECIWKYFQALTKLGLKITSS